MPRLHADMEKLQSNETPYLRNYILKWNERYNENFPRRKFSALAIDVYGRTSCVTRYITPIELPQLNPDNFQVTTQQLAKYISKFSFTDYNKYYQNIWLTAKQFLNIMVGSVVDHAVTLACCLQSLDLHVWLLLGYGTPNGSSAYVLTRESTSNSYAPTYYIFDVTTGTKYNILDSISPLQIIYCVINRKNVWANTQRTNKVTNTRFDFSKISDWLPLFTEEIVGPSISIQQRVAFRTLSNEQYLLQSKLEKKIHKKIAKLTNGETIKFCSSLSKTFKKHMLKFINGCFSDQPDFDIAQTILSVQFSHKQKMKGFLVCKTYTNVSSLLEFIDNTDLLKPLRADSEYILATQLVSWPNQIILWILIAVVY
ncbi:coiled-coil and C2 domain-containing protein 2A [Agrilus planipennis]|uniref:Coiled-coil and C2 domain-containing protein 2A n=1 Tax=Agrilus planipennis TaxID=224129 RepID=A0A1W4WMZ9_AGRPL|nr:coiled-coil and C2 domain-containing protein 2A [Agrilus planipennis]